MGNVGWSILWFLILVIIALWIAGICSWFYIWLYCLQVCFKGLSGFCDMLLKGVQFPHYCAQNMVDGTKGC